MDKDVVDTKAHRSHQNSFTIPICMFHREITVIQKGLLKGGTAQVTISFPEFKLLSFSLFQKQHKE